MESKFKHKIIMKYMSGCEFRIENYFVFSPMKSEDKFWMLFEESEDIKLLQS